MKKVISALLLLAMVIGCFAGCAPEVKEDAGLNSAKEYLYTMYKDADAKTAVDYTVVGQVRINDVTYPITWTVDKTENVKIEAGDNNMVTVKLTPATEDVNYKLTATLKNAEGQEVSVSFDHFIPKADGLPATLADGTYVIVAGNLTMSSLAADKSYGYPTATEVTVADGKVSGHVAADVLTIKNVDGGFTIQDAQGRYFYLKGTYNSFNVDATAPAEGHVFSILVKDGKYLIQNNLDKKTLAYSTSYSSWGCYPELTDDHTSLVDIIAATAPEGTTPPVTETPDNNTGNSGNTGNTGNAGNSGNTGNSGTTTPSTGTVVFSFPKENKYITGTHYKYTSSSGNTKFELALSANKAEALAMEMITNSDNTVTFKAGGQYLFCDGTDVKFVATQSDNTKFVLEAADGGYYIKCAVANFQGKPQYLEVYKDYLTCYGMGSDTSIYVFKLDDASGANGSISAQDGSNAGSSSSGSSSNSGSSSGNTGNSGSTSAPTTINGKLAASIDMKGTTTRTGFSSTQTVHSANGITYTNDKASSQTANVDMTGKTTAARAYKSSTVKVEYTGMVAIVFNLDDYNNGDYLKGFDDMTVSGATITRSGASVTITFASATNVFQSAELGAQVRIISIDVYTAN